MVSRYFRIVKNRLYGNSRFRQSGRATKEIDRSVYVCFSMPTYFWVGRYFREVRYFRGSVARGKINVTFGKPSFSRGGGWGRYLRNSMELKHSRHFLIKPTNRDTLAHAFPRFTPITCLMRNLIASLDHPRRF